MTKFVKTLECNTFRMVAFYLPFLKPRVSQSKIRQFFSPKEIHSFNLDVKSC